MDGFLGDTTSYSFDSLNMFRGNLLHVKVFPYHIQ